MAHGTLVVCYSRTGLTRRVGEHIAAELGATFDCIEDAEPRRGVLGFAHSALESITRGVPLIRTQRDPREFARVVLGSPVWAFSMAAPVRTYLLQYGPSIRLAGLFTVMGGMGGERALREMQLAASTSGVPVCMLRERDVLRGLRQEPLAGFVTELRRLGASDFTGVAAA